MEISLIEKRQALTTWHDELVLGIWRAANRAAQTARQALEADLGEAGLTDTVWDPDRFTGDRIDGVMRLALEGECKALFKQAATDLRAVDAQYKGLARLLTDSLDQIHFPAPIVPDKPTPVAPEQPPAAKPGRIGRVIKSLSDRSFVRGAREWGGWALGKVGEASEAAGQSLQSGTGLYDRIRRSGQARIDNVWMAAGGEGEPVIGQLLEIVRKITDEAREMAL